MADRAGSLPPIEPIKFVPVKGSPVFVGRRDKAERIREAIVDLQLVIDGCTAKQPCASGDVVASVARHCSMFLRKMVVGDDRTPRLLDEEICRTAGFGFDRFRRISGDRRILTLVPVNISGGYGQFTKLDEETGEPEAVHNVPMGPQRLSIAVEWPLPGMADWLSQPTPENAWEIRPEGLFESQSSPSPDCDAWLGQQLVNFNNRGITLKDVIRVMANTEAAHSPPVERLMVPPGDKDKTRFRVVKDSEIHILSYITVCGVRYSHAIVIETAMYLYRKLTRNKLIKQAEGAGEILVLGFAPNDVFLPSQNWLQFDGGLAMAFGGAEQSISHRVRAPR
jgi:hypothetical protein